MDSQRTLSRQVRRVRAVALAVPRDEINILGDAEDDHDEFQPDARHHDIEEEHNRRDSEADDQPSSTFSRTSDDHEQCPDRGEPHEQYVSNTDHARRDTGLHRPAPAWAQMPDPRRRAGLEVDASRSEVATPADTIPEEGGTGCDP